jgi:hypothetical protein
MPLAECGHEVDYIYVDGEQLVPSRCRECRLKGAERAKARGDDLRFLLSLGPDNYARTQELIVEARNQREAEGN